MGVKSLKSMYTTDKGYVHVIVCVCGHFKAPTGIRELKGAVY